MNPVGDVARQQADLVIISVILMLLIIVPVMALTVFFAWRYRHTNTAATYEPNWDHSTRLELVIWAAPLLIIIALGAITWITTHTLDPYRPISRIAPGRPITAADKPLEIDVVSLDWKWLFIYPEQGIATVNELALPTDRQVVFRMTSSSVMNAFYVPTLAGMIYTMPGMETQLHAVLNKTGTYDGLSANYSGAGFSGMHFKVHGLTDADFDSWAKGIKSSGSALGTDAYLTLEKPSENVPVMHFASVDPALFGKVVNMCATPGQPCESDLMRKDMEAPGTGKMDMPMPSEPKGALLKAPLEKGTSPNVTAPSSNTPPGNAAPGSDANRNMTSLTPPPVPGRQVSARS